jgi:hypothetical protein
MNKAETYLDEEARDTYLRRTKVLQFADSLADPMHKEALMQYADQLGQQYLLVVEMASKSLINGRAQQRDWVKIPVSYPQ